MLHSDAHHYRKPSLLKHLPYNGMHHCMLSLNRHHCWSIPCFWRNPVIVVGSWGYKILNPEYQDWENQSGIAIFSIL